MKTIKFYLCLLTLSLTTEQVCSNPTQEIPVISSTTLYLADGNFVTSNDIGILVQLVHGLDQFLLGTPEGPLMLNGTPYSLKTLCLLENKEQNKACVPWNKDTKPQWLYECSIAIANHTKKSQQKATHTHNLQREYIKNFCEMFNLEKSLLLTWATANAADQDAVIFNINSFQALTRFIIDLKNFLSCMICTCPKSTQKFIASISNLNDRKAIEELINSIINKQKTNYAKHKATCKNN